VTVPPTTLNNLYVLPLLFLSIFSPRVYAVSAPVKPIVAVVAPNPATGTTEPQPRVYSQAEIDEMTADTLHPYILRKLIKCESENTNLARLDSNHLVSFGLLQFNGTATWQEFSPLANVSGSPMNPQDAVKVADYMISNGFLGRWTCAHILNLL
jgi:hypothetical protein